MMVKFARNEVIQKVKTLHQTLGDDFANDYRSKAHLGNVLKKEGVETLDQLMKKNESNMFSLEFDCKNRLSRRAQINKKRLDLKDTLQAH